MNEIHSLTRLVITCKARVNSATALNSMSHCTLLHYWFSMQSSIQWCFTDWNRGISLFCLLLHDKRSRSPTNSLDHLQTVLIANKQFWYNQQKRKKPFNLSTKHWICCFLCENMRVNWIITLVWFCLLLSKWFGRIGSIILHVSAASHIVPATTIIFIMQSMHKNCLMDRKNQLA